MPRGGLKTKKRQSTADPVYRSILLQKTINRVMRSGKKTTAQKAIYGALDILKEKGLDPLVTFEKAINNVSPQQEVRAKRIGGAAYQVPMEVRGERKISLSIRWIIQAASKRSNKDYKTFSQKLASELIDAANNSGDAIKKRDIAHRMAEANKAFSHFRF